jgi:hypothetical protein
MKQKRDATSLFSSLVWELGDFQHCGIIVGIVVLIEWLPSLILFLFVLINCNQSFWMCVAKA